MIKKKKRQKDEKKKKEWLKASNTGQGAEQFLGVATLCATQTEQLRLLSHNAGEAESAWKAPGRAVDPGMLQEAVPVTHHLAAPLWMKHTWDIPALWPLCCWKSPLWNEELMSARWFMLTAGFGAPSRRTSRAVAGSSWSVWLYKVVIIGSTAANAWQTQPLHALNQIRVCCCLLISSAYVTLEEAVTPLSLTCLSLALENIFFSVKILTITQVTHSPGNPGS